MITKILKEALLLDAGTDENPQAYVTAYPTKFPLGISQVPPHLYKSLPTIWFGSPGASSLMEDAISTTTRGADSKGSILILLDCSYPSYLYPRGIKSDQTGATTDLVRVVIYKPRHSGAMPGAVEAASHRITKVLDEFVRRQDRAGVMNTSSDLTVDPEGHFACRLIETCGPGRLTMAESALELVFMVEYVRMFL